MDLLEHLRRQFAYDAWANHEVLAVMVASSKTAERPWQLLAHIISAERLWLDRIKKLPQNLPVWPDFSPEECGGQLADLSSRWPEFLSELSPVRFAEKVEYKNTKGELWTSTVEDILTHVLLHSSYHRGQIAAQLRAAREQPPYTDFIHAARQGLIK